MQKGFIRLVALALLLGYSFDAYGFDGYRLLQLDGQYVKWGSPVLGTGADVTYSYVRRERSFPEARNCKRMTPVEPLLANNDIPFAAFRTAIEEAFDMWVAVADITFRYVPDAEDADILIGAQAAPRRWAYANVLHEHTVEGSTTAIAQATVCFNPLQQWKVTFGGDPEIYNIRYVAAHEIGHAIGLDHPGRFGQLMGYGYDELYKDLQSGDIAGITRLYGERSLLTDLEPVR